MNIKRECQEIRLTMTFRINYNTKQIVQGDKNPMREMAWISNWIINRWCFVGKGKIHWYNATGVLAEA